MKIPSRFSSPKKPEYKRWSELKTQLEEIILQYAAPPYQILIASDVVEDISNMAKAGENVAIINLPFFIDVPSKLSDKRKLLAMLRLQLPWADIGYIDEARQYIFIDTKFEMETDMPSILD